MSALTRLVGRTALSRLARDRQFVVFALLSLVLTGVLLAFSGSWLIGVLTFRPAYANPEQLWSLRIVEPALEAGHPGAQASIAAVYRLALQQKALDRIAVAEPKQLRIEGDRRDQGVSVRALMVSDDLWSMLGLTSLRGSPPRSDRQEAAISEQLAIARFGGGDAALGQTLYLESGAFRISAVLSAGFLAPEAIAPQRRGENRVDLILGRSPSAADPAAEGRDASKEMSLIGQSSLGQSQLQALLDAEVAAIGQSLGGRAFRIEIQPLPAAMRGNELALVGSFAAVAALLALTALASLTLVASGRFLAQRRDQSVLLKIGFRPAHAALFEAAEIVLLLVAAGVLAAPVVLTVVALSDYAPATRGLVDAAFMLRLVFLWFAYLAVAGLLLALGLQASRTRDTAGSGARGAAAIRVSLPLLRALQAGQTLVVLAVLSASLALVGDAWRVLAVTRHTAFDAVVQIRPNFPPGTPVASRSEALERMRDALARLPGVEQTALASGPALELIGNGVSYRGPRDIGSHRIVGRSAGGGIITRNDGPASVGAAEIDYSIMPIQVEPAFFSILGYRLRAGRALEGLDRNAVVLSPEARRALFEGEAGVGELVPAPPPTNAADSWHGGLRVVGIADAGRVFDAVPGFNPFATTPVVFLPWSRDPAQGGAAEPAPVVVLRHRPGAAPDPVALQQALDVSVGAAFKVQVQHLGVEVRRRLRRHLLAAGIAVALGLLVVLSAALGALGTMRLIAETRRADLAVRMAIGAWPGRVARELLLAELRWPALLAVAWGPLSLLFGVVAEAIGWTWAGPLPAIASAIAVLGILAIGLYAGLARTLALRPLEILREVDAGQ
ncbi:MAG: ABC transporter permease [Lysobacterales bacterium]